MMTTFQAKITARESLPPVILFTTVVEYKPNWGKKFSTWTGGMRGGGGAYRVSDKVVQEPRSGNSEQSDPIALEDQPVRDFGVPHRITPEPLGLFHIQPPNQDSEGGDDTKSK